MTKIAKYRHNDFGGQNNDEGDSQGTKRQKEAKQKLAHIASRMLLIMHRGKTSITRKSCEKIVNDLRKYAKELRIISVEMLWDGIDEELENLEE